MATRLNSIHLGTVTNKEGSMVYGTDVLVDEEGNVKTVNWITCRRLSYVW